MSKKSLSKHLVFWLNNMLHREPQNREELVELFRDSEQNALIDPDTRDMLEGVMDITEQRVRDIMIPRSQINTISINHSLEECLAVISNSVHSRYPVISEDKDHVEGILLAKDLLCYVYNKEAEFDIRQVMRPAVIVPESKRVDQMLKEFRSQRYHMALVVDEFGGISGLVTIEDILELIVGDIEDEFDEIEDRDIRPLTQNSYSVRALMPIDEFNEAFETQFSEEDVDTIGGLVMQKFGHLPTRGETLILNNYQFKVSVADSRRIIQLHVTLPEDAPQPTEDA